MICKVYIHRLSVCYRQAFVQPVLFISALSFTGKVFVSDSKEECSRKPKRHSGYGRHPRKTRRDNEGQGGIMQAKHIVTRVGEAVDGSGVESCGRSLQAQVELFARIGPSSFSSTEKANSQFRRRFSLFREKEHLAYGCLLRVLRSALRERWGRGGGGVNNRLKKSKLLCSKESILPTSLFDEFANGRSMLSQEPLSVCLSFIREGGYCVCLRLPQEPER